MIDVAFHIRDLPAADMTARSVTRLYVGDEFCARRLPSPDRLARFCRSADESGLGVTLLTPILSDADIETHESLFEVLSRRHTAPEVVVNDWGVMRFLRTRHPEFRIAAGRLLDKGFKDPRTPASDQGADADPLLSGGAFDQAHIREMLHGLGVGRLERDLSPHCSGTGRPDDRFGLSVYYPFGCVATGRICWPASPRQGFAPAGPCDRICETLSMQLLHPDVALPVFQNGNTVFYRYSPVMLSSLRFLAESRPLRLVFQGRAMGCDDPAPEVQIP